MRMFERWVGVGLLLLATAGPAHAQSTVVDDVQVTIRVLANGSLDVTERVQVRATVPAEVRWPLGGRRTGDVRDLTIAAVTPPAVRTGIQFERNGSQVRWAAPAGVSAVAVRYRLPRCVSVADGRSLLRLDAVPLNHGDAINIAKVIVELPQAYPVEELATDLETAAVNTNTQHRVLNGRTFYYEGRQLAPGTTLTVVARWPVHGVTSSFLLPPQLDLLQPLAVALAALLVLWWGYRKQRRATSMLRGKPV